MSYDPLKIFRDPLTLKVNWNDATVPYIHMLEAYYVHSQHYCYHLVLPAFAAQ